MKIFDRYMIREFIGPFLFCVSGFTVVLLSGLLFELTDLILVNEVAVFTVSKMLFYRIPGIAVMTLPIATLFATLLAIGRFVQDNEMTVLRGSGVSFPRLIMPILVMGILISVLTFWASEDIVPRANHEFETILRKIVFSEGIPVVQENVFFHGGDDRYFYIGEVDTKTNEIQTVLVYELDTDNFPSITSAQTGIFQDHTWVLNDGVYQELDEEGFVQFESRFQRMEIITEQEGEVYLGNQRSVDEMNRKELGEHIERFQRGGLKVLSFVVDYHLKLALPLAPFVFALFSAPLALLGKGGRSFGVVISLVILLVYYVAVSLSRSLGVNETLPPVVAAWLVNTVFAASGFVFLFRSDRLR
ncbi:MAG TPA: YjgP/YjgQ family permease [Firmicutes bacterium]|jgi:lipopolysaccharide export system permease protein|nr:YjgP/YjgQ family permease [Bacillota bacterium]